MTSRGFNGTVHFILSAAQTSSSCRDERVRPVSKHPTHPASRSDTHTFLIVDRFCGLKGHEMFCEVERSYIEDGFNLYGLRACVSNFSDCLDLILDRIGPDDSDDSHLTQSACTLYGLIHARYIITAHGLDAMYNKYAAKDFGTCPLVQCSGQPVLPVGLKDEMGVDTVKIFCPKCTQVYHTPPLRSRANVSTGVDGAAFGTTFPHLFLMTFSNLVPDPLPVESSYVPRVFGFRVHQLAQRALPSPETAAPAVAAVEKVNSTINTSNANSNNNNAMLRDFGDEDEDEKSPAQGEEAPVANPPAAAPAAEAAPTNNIVNNTSSINNAALAVAAAAAAPAAMASNIANAAAAATNAAGRSRSKAKRGRKEDKATAAATTAAMANAPVAPTFLMENPAKRRRRGAGNA
uniref:Casein kinase II subunit beta n=1 Tax=Amphora coffeiformis TaxID=265554 RepID=A0A7S3PDD2_9STRA